MYSTANGVVTDAEAAEIDSLNKEIWKNFWSIPREKRTKADWEKLLDIQILVKKGWNAVFSEILSNSQIISSNSWHFLEKDCQIRGIFIY